MKNYLFSLLAGCILISIGGCKRDDDEPQRERKPISRLYVSTAEFEANSATSDLPNVFAIDSVDLDKLPSIKKEGEFISGAKGGNTIHFSPFSAGIIFQSSVNNRTDIDTTIHVMSVSKAGVLSNTATIRNRAFDKVRGMVYTVVNDGKLSEDYLLALNASDTVPARLFAIKQPRNQRNYTRARYRMQLGYTPWGIMTIDNDVLITKADIGTTGIAVYKDFLPRLLLDGDSVMADDGSNVLKESYLLTINGANSIRGISYSKAQDILLATDFTGSEENSVGKILVFEDFSKYTTTQNITPTRVITGAATGLRQPLDVAIDTREGAKYFFVADPLAKRVFRFLISDNGNVQANDEMEFNGKSPRSVSLDSR